LELTRADQASQLQALVRTNFDSYVRCADRIEQYAAQIEAELSSRKAPSTGTSAAGQAPIVGDSAVAAREAAARAAGRYTQHTV
jgi:hypothetical protein